MAGIEKGALTVTFAEQGRIGARIEQMSPAFVKVFPQYVNKTDRH